MPPKRASGYAGALFWRQGAQRQCTNLARYLHNALHAHAFANEMMRTARPQRPLDRTATRLPAPSLL